MKVFLSHSSRDKGFVEAVTTMLRPGTFELDTQTFDTSKQIARKRAILPLVKNSIPSKVSKSTYDEVIEFFDKKMQNRSHLRKDFIMASELTKPLPAKPC